MSYYDIPEPKRPIVCVSGGFDIYHKGHADMIKHAATYGSVVVILNSDAWLVRKKGYNMLDWGHRCEIMNSIKGVCGVSAVDDSDGTVCEALERIRPDYFANGGDRKIGNTPELSLCKELGITPLFNIGGEKTASSSEIVNAIQK